MNRAFTLIELLTVIIIVSVLVAMLVPPILARNNCEKMFAEAGIEEGDFVRIKLTGEKAQVRHVTMCYGGTPRIVCLIGVGRKNRDGIVSRDSHPSSFQEQSFTIDEIELWDKHKEGE